MKFDFSVDIPLLERIKILWYGRLSVFVDYKGQKKLYVEMGAEKKVTSHEVKENDDNNTK